MSESKKLVVVGLGYVGLPVAEQAAQKGWEVHGLEINETKINEVNQSDNGVTATSDPTVCTDAHFVIVAVPTPVHEDYTPDLKPLTSALESIAPHLQTGQVLSIESTINPGVTEEIITPLLSKAGAEGVHIVHCPERINPGDPDYTVGNIDRVLGGVTPEAAELAKKYYESILDSEITLMATVTEAEAVKIMENTFRDINIAFVNEMAQSFAKLDIDITNVIKGASTKPFAFLAHHPGNGVGGHCISVDPYYMIEKAKQVGFDHKFLQLARDINNSMPAYTVSLLEETGETNTALLGLAYKKNIDDIRESPSLKIIELLTEKNYSGKIYDPYVQGQLPDEVLAKSGLEMVGSLDEALTGVDALILSTDHDEFVEKLTPEYLKAKNISVVIDGKNALDKKGLIEAGINYKGIGR